MARYDRGSDANDLTREQVNREHRRDEQQEQREEIEQRPPVSVEDRAEGPTSRPRNSVLTNP
ncbi:MAG: hypothetical protein ABI446_09185 [Gemmatimonadaceae bacterium]